MSELDTSYLAADISDVEIGADYPVVSRIDQVTYTSLAESLGYVEDDIIKELRSYLVDADYSQTDIPVAQAVNTFELHCDQVAGLHENSSDRLTVRRGLRLSEAAVYYHVKDYVSCAEQLRLVINDVQVSSTEEQQYLPNLYKILRHVQECTAGQKVTEIVAVA